MSKGTLKNIYDSESKGTYFAQVLCTVCKKIITGSSSNPENGARSDLGSKFSEHKKECEQSSQ